mmetsp:Transcript_54422/g.133016  ORF Transcript_54422/g.133016 Transcript_54422/m.133016 type:complete len:139 (+) Transcript_54422:372-788(+)
MAWTMLARVLVLLALAPLGAAFAPMPLRPWAAPVLRPHRTTLIASTNMAAQASHSGWNHPVRPQGFEALGILFPPKREGEWDAGEALAKHLERHVMQAVSELFAPEDQAFAAQCECPKAKLHPFAPIGRSCAPRRGPH